MKTNQFNFDSSWSEWQAIDNGPEKSGVYCIRATSDGKSAISIPRALCIDDIGIVYIGKSKNLYQRLGYLKWIYDDNYELHQWHQLIKTWFHYDFERLASRKLLQVRWKTTDVFDKMERYIINEYKQYYGDIPIGNTKTEGINADNIN